ncbi:uncharacterized protein GGS25DRAFT_485659 [Hypoxylon fragiforme]|uniref:uncharacterized protein n=1 Tax=Hypoxylon fragiforme TaxID=63214 RepID=UPI0020C5EE61|nr:uncharacterized protein GGS25DRAFT_485659 [Hypoxylon fragiforme]KAI2609661.1 hypothetical protein GGS25DRAFT_485659 [Hypoxylon fragiforme]
MADARALLRAHRAENRIKHPYAAYSDAGKLLCKLCHEPIKSDALWEGHIRGPSHTKRLQNHSQPQLVDRSDNDNGGKRKLDDSTSEADDDDAEDTIRTKRSRTDMAASNHGSSENRQTPPELSRRTSNPPGHGVEIAIPSRPATPAAGGSNSATSTPKAAHVGRRSPLMGSDTNSTPPTSATLPSSAAATSLPISTSTTNTQTAAAAVDEAEWAAFEAEVVATPVTPTNTSTNTNPYTSDAIISAPALSTAQLAAKSREEENERRKHLLLDGEIADEREDATRALEAEFEEMEELESRVRRLKERREALRKGGKGRKGRRGSAVVGGDEGVNGNGNNDNGDNNINNTRTSSNASASSDIVMAKGSPLGADADADADTDKKSGVDNSNSNNNDNNSADNDSDDDEDEDDWDAFRFR